MARLQRSGLRSRQGLRDCRQDIPAQLIIAAAAAELALIIISNLKYLAGAACQAGFHAIVLKAFELLEFTFDLNYLAKIPRQPSGGAEVADSVTRRFRFVRGTNETAKT